MLKYIFLIIFILVALYLLMRFFLIPNFSSEPKNIKTPNPEQANHTLSHLSDCPDKPNCVSSTATRSSQKVEAISFEGSSEEAMNTLKDIVTQLPKNQIVTEQNNYLHVVFKSPLMEFVDDTEFLIDKESNTIQVRSAARLGRRDFDKNRERIELIRKQFQD